MTADARPWYAQPLLWGVLSPLVVTVVACIWLVIKTTELGGVDALPGEYTKTGKLVALDEAALARSRTLALVARGQIDSAAGRLRIAIDRDDLPPELQAQLVHATLPERDVSMALAWDGDGWSGVLPGSLPQRGEVHVHPADRSWRLVAPIVIDQPLDLGASRR